jgi:hypothetical protein
MVMMMITIAIAITMLGTASLKRLFILGLRDAAPGFLKRRNPMIKALQHALLILLKLLSLIAFLLSLRLLLIGSVSGRQKRKRESSAKREHDVFQHFCLLKIVNWIACLPALYYAPLSLTAWRRLG